MPLLRDLFASGLACVNACGRGIRVNEDLEASPGLFVLGPLLAGHASRDLAIWNLESAPRIDALARRLAVTLARRCRSTRED